MKNIFLVISLVCIALLQANGQTANNKYDSSIDDSDLFKKDVSAVVLTGEFLYWTVQESALDYAITMNYANSATTSYAQGNYQRASFDWDPGFRATIGWFNAPKYWEVKGQYTWMRNSGSNASSKPSTATYYLNGTFPQLVSSYVVQRATSRITMRYDLADLLVSRAFHPNPHLRMRLTGGLAGALIRQHWTVKYYDATNVEIDTRNNWKFLGGGLRIGIDLDWFWGYDFYLTGLVSTTGQIGKYKNISKAKASSQATYAKDSSYEDYRIAYAAQFIIGPSYQRSFASCRFEIFAGYELTSWFNLHEIFRSSGSTIFSDAKETYINDGIVCLDGLSARLTFNF